MAIGIFAVIAAFMSQELAGGLRGVLGSKRREVATQEANRVLEIARSLSYGAVGLVSADPTIGTCASLADSALSCQAGKISYHLSGSTYEPIVWATSPSGHPFNPHTAAVARGSTDLTRYVYVTGVDSNADGTIDMRRVFVRVSWDDSGSRGPKNEVTAQTLIHPNGTPTGAGAGTPLTGESLATGGSLKIDSSLLGLSAPLHITLPTSTGSSRFRAVSTTNCSTKSAAVNVLDVVDLSGEPVTVTADDDSRTETPSDPAAQSKTGVLNIPAGPVANLVGSTISSPITCEADIAEYGHEAGTGSPLATSLNAQTDVLGLGGDLNWLLTLASVDTLPVTQEINHEIVNGQREVHSRASAASGVISILKLPSAGITDGLVRIDGLSYGASVRAADGTPSAAPAVTAPTISLGIYDNGNKIPGCTSRSGGYCVLSVNPAAAGFAGATYNVTHDFTQLLGLNAINLSYTTTVSILPPTKTPVAGEIGANGEKRWSAEYTPMSVATHLNASVLGNELINANVDLDVGTVRARACAGTTCL